MVLLGLVWLGLVGELLLLIFFADVLEVKKTNG